MLLSSMTVELFIFGCSAGSIFLDNHIDKVEEYRLFCKKQVDLRDDDYADYLNNNDHWGRDFNFEGSSLQERRFLRD